MKVTYRSDATEILSASVLVSRTFYTFWQRYWCIPVYILIGIGLVYFLRRVEPFYLGYIPAHLRGIAGFSVFLVAALVCVKLVQYFSLPLYGRWLQRQIPDTDITVEAGDDKLYMAYGETSWNVGFADVRQIVVDRNMIGFIVGASVVYVPLRAFGSISDAHGLMRKVYAKMPEAARQRSLAQRAVRDIVSSSAT